VSTSTRNQTAGRPGDDAQVATGLRERKKARTKTAIQQQALRLFREQGYHATTVEQVAAAAEVAPSTVFRYFPTKEDLAALEDYYSLANTIREAFEAQPPELSPVQALRGAFRAAFGSLSPRDRAARYERDVLVVVIPELWAANLGLITKSRRMMCELLASRVGRDPNEAPVRALTDAVFGIGLGVLLDSVESPDGDPAEAMDAALAHLESGRLLS
jgi:AcrR family transcriptional regulator